MVAKNLEKGILTLCLILLTSAPAFACHIIDVAHQINCTGYQVTIKAWVHKNYVLTLDLTLKNGSGYSRAFHHQIKFTSDNTNAVTVFSRSWNDTLCGGYTINSTVKLKDQCAALVDSRYTTLSLNCSCYQCVRDSDCSDSNVCNGTERCVNNQCVAGTPLNCDDGNICTNDSCNTQSGCQHVNNNAFCNDNSVCTTEDRCVNGVCQGGTSLNCDDGDGCTTDTCNPLTGCLNTPVAGCECDEHSDCSDNSVCTGTETCNAQNKCVAGTPIDCNDGNICTTDGCDAQAGCQQVNNTSACNDTNACTTDDRCAGGSCGGTPLICNDGNGCTNDTCDPGTGCIYTPIAGCQCDEHSDCTDDNVCTGTETCNAQNKCVAGTPIDCNDGNICTTDSCDAQAGCQHLNNTSACDDGSVCTAGDSCANGVCEPGSPISCDDGDGCTTDTCDPEEGCLHTHIDGCECDDDSDCTDNNTCTGTETCNAQNKCVAGTPIDCNDGNICTNDVCDSQAGCQQVNNTSACDDGSVCTAGDSCANGACQPGNAISCDDGNGCTNDTCDPGQGCIHTPIAGCECDSDSDCSDNNVCTGTETCNAQSKCVAGTLLDCNDGNVCTNDSCDAVSGCQHLNNVSPCDDGSVCTAGDHCVSGACQPGNAISCDDGDECTDDSCDAGLGCLHTPVAGCECDADGDCTDSNVCTGAETCVDNTCVAGTPLSCDDGNVCTNDVCDPQAGCQHLNNASPCDDGNVCTAGDHCVNGVCQPGAPISCDDGDGCTTDTCDPQQGCLNIPLDGCECDTDSDCSDNNACTGVETCVATKCVAGTPLNCNDGNVCTDDSCDAQAGCEYLNNDSPCNDGNVCTAGDQCTNGVCQPVASISCDDGDGCTTDTCDPGQGCIHTLINGCECDTDGDCSDNNLCTGTESCVGMECEAGTPLSCNDGNICTDDSCDAQAGCQYVNNASPCDDGSVCTAGDHCVDGACQPGTPISCNDGDGCTTDTCDPELGCIHTPISGCQCDENSDCSDNNVCTGVETCVATKCVAGTPLTCNDGNICTDDSCNAQAGCQHLNNVSPCDDGSVCTAGDRCVSGACQPGNTISCDDGDGCTTDSCDPQDGCIHTLINGCECDDHSDCSDFTLCNGEERCVDNKCVDGASLNCDDGNLCTTDSCVPEAGCQHQNNSMACSDGSMCTSGDHCANGVCVGGALINCNDGNGCTTDTCDPEEGCLYTPIAGCQCDENSDCSDNNVCTGVETCVASKCVAGTPLTCNDGNPCTTDSCDAQAGCQYVDTTLPCDDGNVCTVGDHCANGVCEGGSLINCDDGNGCTTDTCDPEEGCLHTLIEGCQCDENSDCSDNNVCTGEETCVGMRCVEGTPLNCNDGNVCTDDSCDPQGGCRQVNNTSACSDGSVCTAGDHCANGVCLAGAPISCDDGDGCTTDTCDPGEGCVHTPIQGCECDANGDCNDNNVCTGVETCVASKCVAGTPLNCSDGNVCTDDSCHPLTGCQHLNNTSPCSDTNTCTAEDACANGSCQGTPISCDDGDGCTTDTCNTQTGCVHTPIAGCECDGDSDCEDGLFCNGRARCSGGKCQPGSNPCDDGFYCNGVEGCNEANDQCTSQHSGSPCALSLFCDDVSDTCGECLTDEDCDDGNTCSVDSCTGEPRACVHSCCVDQCEHACCQDPVCANEPFCGAQVSIEAHYAIAEPAYPQRTFAKPDSFQKDYPFPGGVGVKVGLCLDNENDLVGGVQLDVCEYDPAGDPLNCMECIDCELTERTTMFDCVVLELPNGCCRVILFCKNPGCAINPGFCDIVTVVYKMKELSQECPAMECITVMPEQIIVSDYNGYELTAAGHPGEVCPFVCGDVCPPDNPSVVGWDCGDGVADIFDILCEVDFVLTLTTPDECQAMRADVPTGTPPNCVDPDGSINILDIMVLIDMGLSRQDCCSYYYTGQIY